MRLELDARARRLLRRVPGRTVYTVAELVLLALLAVQVARLVWAVVTPVSPLGEWRPREPAVAGSAAAALAAAPFFRLDAPAAGSASVTALQLHLFGVRVDEATGRGSAIVAGPDGVQQSVAVGAEVAPGVVLRAVAYDHVTLGHGGADEQLYFDQSGAPPPAVGVPGGPAAVPAGIGPLPPVPPGAVPLAQLRGEIGFTPRLDGGRLAGLVVRPLGSGAVFRAAGLREGDVVTAVNGRPPTGAADFESLAGPYAGGGTLPVTVERNGQPVPLTIAIAPR